MWYSGDGGARWTSLDFYASVRAAGVAPGAAPVHADAAAVGAIAVAFRAPAGDVVYVGPGARPAVGRQLATQPGIGAGGAGIRVSTGPAPAVEGAGAAAADPWRVEAAELTGLVVRRLVEDPAAPGVVWAATNRGLFRREPGAAGTVTWRSIETGVAAVSDVAAVLGPGSPLAWVYVAGIEGTLRVSPDAGTTWHPVALPPIGPAPAPGAVAPYGRPALTVGNVPLRAVVWLAAAGGRLWRVEAPGGVVAAEVVGGVPTALAGAADDLVVAVHPDADVAHQDVIAIAGRTPLASPAGEPQAALFVGRVTRGGAGLAFPMTPGPVGQPPAEWRGAGVAPGVRCLAWVTGPGPLPVLGPPQLWVGTDVGLFRSDNDGVRGSFRARNSGFAATECTALAQHPTEPGVLCAGVGGLGTARRVTGATWQAVQLDSARPAPAVPAGALVPAPVYGGFVEPSAPGIAPSTGGGVGIDPGDPRRIYAQAGPGRWQHSADGGRSFAELAYLTAAAPAASAARQTAWRDAQRAERAASAERSRFAALALVPDPEGEADGRGSLLALGTDRVWYTDTELAEAAEAAGGMRTGWVTLPTGTDPYDPARPGGAAAPDRTQDRLAGAVLGVRFGSPDRIYALSRRGVYLMQRNLDRSWQPLRTLYDQASVRLNWKGKTPRGQIPSDLPLLELATHDPDVGLGTLYAGTGAPGSASGEGGSGADHLWWFDGTDSWQETGLPVDVAVHAVVVDPVHPETVYVGTDLGVWRGVGSFPGGLFGPSWTWTQHSHGLPEGPCVDLLVHPPSATPPAAGEARVIRAAIAGRGVWEVALDARSQGPEVSVGAHAHDVRRTPVAPGGARDPFDPASGQVRLDASPDVRVWRSPGAAPARPPTLPVGPASDPFDVWHLQSALRAAGEPIAVDGRWSAAVAPALAHRQAALTPPLPAAPTAAALWDAVQDGSPLPFDVIPADPADLVAHLRDEPDRWPKAPTMSCVSGDGLVRVRIVVHGRHWRALPTARVQVALLKVPCASGFGVPGTESRPGWPNLADVPPLPAGWAAALAADRAVAPGAQGAWLAASAWTYADPGSAFRSVAGPVDPANPQIALFDVDLRGPAWSWPGWLLLAVVVADDDMVAATETDVGRLVRTSRHVAARSVRRGRLLPRPFERYPGIDIFYYPTAAVMSTAWDQSNIVWTGLYYDSPRPEPALGEAGPPFPGGHNRNLVNPVPGAANSWTRAWNEIHPKFGVAAIYWGQQMAPGGPGPFNLTVPFAEANAADAVAQAAASGIPSGTVVYLDYENAFSPAGGAYCQAFFRRIAESGFRPGVYAHAPVSVPLRREIPGLNVWCVRTPILAPGATVPGAWTVTSGVLMLNSVPVLGTAPDRDPLMHQWVFDTGLLFPLPGNPVVGIAGQAFRPDLDVSLVADPSYPERRSQPLRIRFGKAAVASSATASAGVYAVRRGRPRRTIWSPGAAVADPSLDTVRLPCLWNPFSPPVALQSAQPVDTLLAFGYGSGEGEHVWRVQELRRFDTGRWRHTVVPQDHLALDPLTGVIAADRTGEAPEVFAVALTSGLIVGARRDPDTGRWSALRTLTTDATAGTGAAVTTPVRRTSRPAVVNRATDLLDLCWADLAGSVQTASSSMAGTWAGPARAAEPTVRCHPLANIALVSRTAGSMELVYIGRRDATPDWRVYATPWTAAGGWGTTAVVGGAATAVDPMVPIGVCARDAATVDAFVAGIDGLLYLTTFTAGAWTALRQVGGAAVRLASVDGASTDGAGGTSVVVTGRDGELYAWGTALADATPLERLTPLNLV